MEMITLLLIAAALSMDAFAVSVSNGLCYGSIRAKHVFRIAATFGLFQAAMPLAGYYLGRSFARQISAVDHWIALLLLAAIGIHMIAEAAADLRSAPDECPVRTFTFRGLLVQGVATSIDALAVGISFALIETGIWSAVLIIGAVTFIISAGGVALGKKIGIRLGRRAEIAGGLLLIGIGIRIFIEHAFFA